MPIILPLSNILDDHVSFEAYVSHEFAIRDRDFDGIVSEHEQRRSDGHYKIIRGFWNNSKGAGNVRRTIPDDGVMDFATWNQQNNMMLKREHKNGPIPEGKLRWRFNHFDRNKDGELSWWEYWSTIDEDRVYFHHFKNLFAAIDGGELEGDGVITRDDLLAYYNELNEDGSLTPLEIDAQVF